MSATPRHVIGLTGLPSSGKGEVTSALLDCARERGWRGAHLSFSDVIKEEAASRGVPESEFERGLLSRIATELRETEGPGVLAVRIADKITNRPQPTPELFVVEALRHPGEADALREAFGDRFQLVAVDCEPRTIARRLIARARPDESREALQSEEKATQLLAAELHGGESDRSPNVGRTMAVADLHLDNNGTLEELRARVNAFCRELD